MTPADGISDMARFEGEGQLGTVKPPQEPAYAQHERGCRPQAGITASRVSTGCLNAACQDLHAHPDVFLTRELPSARPRAMHV